VLIPLCILYRSVCTAHCCFTFYDVLSKLAVDHFAHAEFVGTFLHWMLIMGLVMQKTSVVGRANNCSVEMNAIWKLGEDYCSPVIFCELEVRCLFGV